MLIFSNKYLGSLSLFVNLNAYNFSWAKCVTDELLVVFIKSDDINLFLITDFVHNCLNACTVTTDECTNWVNTRYGADYSKFCTTTSFASNGFNLNGTSFHFWNFLAEKEFDELFVTSA
ncbi:hypothetical protein D3C73_1468140 [compost metagenome]